MTPPTSALVERLRSIAAKDTISTLGPLCTEAADELERLQAEVERKSAALAQIEQRCNDALGSYSLYAGPRACGQCDGRGQVRDTPRTDAVLKGTLPISVAFDAVRDLARTLERELTERQKAIDETVAVKNLRLVAMAAGTHERERSYMLREYKLRKPLIWATLHRLATAPAGGEGNHEC